MKKKVINVPKLKIDASSSILPFETRMINAIAAPLISTVKVGTPFFETAAREPGITRCLAIEKRTLDPPRIAAMVADAVANSAEMEMNFKMKILPVAAFSASSSGALEVPIIFQFTSPTSTTDTPM
jgi:hypothetical protein